MTETERETKEGERAERERCYNRCMARGKTRLYESSRAVNKG